MPSDFPTWTLPVIAISLAVIAALLAAFAVGALLALRGIATQMQQQKDLLNDFKEMLGIVKLEAEALVRTSRGVRRAVVRGVKRTQAKLLDLEDLYDVLHAEVEDTALDVAATLRSVRRGSGVIGRLKRLIIPGR